MPRPSSTAYESSWEPGVAGTIAQKLAERPPSEGPLMVALVGIPGGGKSVSSDLLARELEANHGIPAMVFPHDGYHLPLEELKRSPNADDLVYRRGAPDTFDPHTLKEDLDRIKNGGTNAAIAVPGFDHARGDPEPGAHVFDPRRHRVVIGEGLYLLHESDGWEGVKDRFDLRIFLEADLGVCMDRLKIRNLDIPGYTPDEIRARVDKVDRANAVVVQESRSRADLVVRSLAAAAAPSTS